MNSVEKNYCQANINTKVTHGKLICVQYFDLVISNKI